MAGPESGAFAAVWIGGERTAARVLAPFGRLFQAHDSGAAVDCIYCPPGKAFYQLAGAFGGVVPPHDLVFFFRPAVFCFRSGLPARFFFDAELAGAGVNGLDLSARQICGHFCGWRGRVQVADDLIFIGRPALPGPAGHLCAPDLFVVSMQMQTAVAAPRMKFTPKAKLPMMAMAVIHVICSRVILCAPS